MGKRNKEDKAVGALAIAVAMYMVVDILQDYLTDRRISYLEEKVKNIG